MVGELLPASGRGDLGAFGAFYDRTAPTVFGVLRRGLSDVESARVATESVYLRLWRGSVEFEPARQCAYGLLLAAIRRELGNAARPASAPG